MGKSWTVAVWGEADCTHGRENQAGVDQGRVWRCDWIAPCVGDVVSRDAPELTFKNCAPFPTPRIYRISAPLQIAVHLKLSCVFLRTGLLCRYKTYFSYLKSAELPRIDTLVTLMPGTTKTGVELIRDLRLRNSGGKPPAAADGGGSSLGSGGQGSVQLVLLACTKIGGDQTELYEEIEDIVKEADEVWSIGPDLYSHYDELFAGYSKKGMKRLKHKELIFTPEKPNGPEGKKKFWKNFFASGSLTRVVSLWQEGTPYQYRGNTVKAKSHGSSLEDYCCLCKALGKISAELFDRKRKLEWEILGPDDVIATMVSSIRSSQTKGKHTFQIQGVTLPSSAETLCNKKLIRSTVFIAPERTEDTFNFAAYEVRTAEAEPRPGLARATLMRAHVN